MSNTILTSSENTSALRTLSDYTSSTTSTSSLDKNAFLQLLVAQLSCQDPLEPASDTEFIAQLAQFTMLEQITALNTTTGTGQAYSLMGKYVSVDKTGQGTDYIFGLVDGVTIKDGTTYLVIGDGEYAYENVVAAINAADSNLEQLLADSVNLIGKTITAEITNSQGNTTTVSGVVSYITAQDSAVYAVVNGAQVPVGSITQIQG